MRRPTRDITVTGISSSAAPINVKFVGQHQYLGDVLFGNFSSNLIGVPQLMSHGLELHCARDKMDITRSSNQSLIYTGFRNKHCLYECDINVTPTVMHAYNVVLEPLDNVPAPVKTASPVATPYPAMEVN